MTTDTLTAALAQVQADLPVVPKSNTARVPTKTGGSYSYTFADLASITHLVLPRLAAVGLAWTCGPTLDDGRFVMRWELRHTSGESITGLYPLPSSGSPQELGSAITYGRRYCLTSVVGIAPEDDDDGAAASQHRAHGSRRGGGNTGRAVDDDARPPTARRTAQREPPPSPPSADFDLDAPPPADESAAIGNLEAAGFDVEVIDGGGQHAPDPITDAQLRRLGVEFRQSGVASKDDRIAFVYRIVGREVSSSKELTKDEATRVIRALTAPTDGKAWPDVRRPQNGGN